MLGFQINLHPLKCWVKLTVKAQRGHLRFCAKLSLHQAMKKSHGWTHWTLIFSSGSCQRFGIYFNVWYTVLFSVGMSKPETTIELKIFFWVLAIINLLLISSYTYRKRLIYIPFLPIILAARLPWSGGAIAAWPVVLEMTKFTCPATPAILCMGIVLSRIGFIYLSWLSSLSTGSVLLVFCMWHKFRGRKWITLYATNLNTIVSCRNSFSVSWDASCIASIDL